MSSPDPKSLWQSNRQHIRTNIGKWFAGKDVTVRGRSLFDHWASELSFVQFNVLNITGRLIDERVAKWIEISTFFTSYPDARIWCNQLGALAGTQNTSPAAGFVLGCLAADSKSYGSRSQYLTVVAVQEMYQQYTKGASAADIAEGFPKARGFPMIPGFARPVRVHDERLDPARRLTAELGFERGEHMHLAEDVSQYLLDAYGLGMNAAGFSSAFLLDQGFTAEEVYRLRVADVASGVMACFSDHAGQPENSFLPLQCNDIRYCGPSKRSLLTNGK